MKGWLNEWYNEVVDEKNESIISEETKKDIERLYGLEGEAFTKDFIQTLIKHHNVSIDLNSLCETEATHPELRELCTEMKDKQLTDISELEALNKNQ
jgi:uncharacterized protein (DUF305 family)